jgi:hypothetical protein
MLLFDHYIVKFVVRAKVKQLRQKARKNQDQLITSRMMATAKVNTIDVDDTRSLQIVPFQKALLSVKNHGLVC